MTPAAMLATSAALGLMVLAAGTYALLYGAARLKGSQRLLVLAALAYAVLALDTAGLVLAAPLAPAWKLLVACSALAYLAIPPVTWRYLKRIHGDEGANA